MSRIGRKLRRRIETTSSWNAIAPRSYAPVNGSATTRVGSLPDAEERAGDRGDDDADEDRAGHAPVPSARR